MKVILELNVIDLYRGWEHLIEKNSDGTYSLRGGYYITVDIVQMKVIPLNVIEKRDIVIKKNLEVHMHDDGKYSLKGGRTW